MLQVNVPSPSWEIPVEVPGWGVYFPTLEVSDIPLPVQEYLISLGYLKAASADVAEVIDTSETTSTDSQGTKRQRKTVAATAPQETPALVSTPNPPVPTGDTSIADLQNP